MAENNKIGATWSGLDMQTHLSNMGKQGMGSFQGAYPSGRNFILYSGPDGKATVPRKFRGTRKIVWDAQAGVNTGNGTYWDETGNTLIAFIHNEQGNHCIIWHKPDVGITHTIPIPEMELRLGYPVTGVALVNQELLVFTDGNSYPKCINLPRADDTDKKSIVRLYFPPSTLQVPIPRQFDVAVTLNGVPQTPFTILFTATPQEISDFTPMNRRFADAFNANNLYNIHFTAVSKANYVEFTAANTGMWSVKASILETTGSTTVQTQCVSEYYNRYNEPFTREQVILSRLAPQIPPTAIMATDTGRKTNQIEGRVFQFQYSYILKDHERSLTSPISDIALPPTAQCQNAQSAFNCIDIAFDDHWLSEVPSRGEIEQVILYMREGNDGTWYVFQTLDKWEWMYSRSFRFFNDGSYAPSDQAFNEASFTSVPPVANALDLFIDSDDNTRGVLGGITEGDDNPTVEVITRIRFDPTVPTVGSTAKVRARILIWAAFDPVPGGQYNLNQPIGVYDNSVGVVYGGMGRASVGHTGDPETWDQRLPLGGFVLYAAGTDKYGISRQVVPVTSFSCGTNQPTLWTVPSGNVAAGRNVYDLTRTGTALFNNCNDSHRAAARHALERIAVWSEVEVDGLVPGETYVFRLPSNNVSILNDGSRLDLNATGFGYQTTSMPVVQVGSVSTATIKPSQNGCTVTIPLNGGGTTIDIGDIIVIDATRPGLVSGSTKLQGYVFDDLGNDYSATNDIRTVGVSAERQMVVLARFFAGNWMPGWPSTVVTTNPTIDMIFNNGTNFTDHNGYWFHWQGNAVGQTPRAAVIGTTTNPLFPSGTVLGFGPSTVNVADFQVMNDINDSKWEGELNGALVAVGPALFSGGGSASYIFANLNPSLALRTHVLARFATSSGAPVEGISVVLEGGRVSRSLTDGTVNIVAFADVQENQNRRVRDRLVGVGTGACQVTLPQGGIFGVSITQFEAGNPYSETVHLDLGDILAMIAGVGNGRGFGRGAVHGLAMRTRRWNGDTTRYMLLKYLEFPLLTQNLVDYDPLAYDPTTYPNGLWLPGIGLVDFEIMGDVPIPWIGRWDCIQFGLTDDLTREFFLQWLASQVVYSSRFNPELVTTDPGEPIPTTYSNGNATEIYISLTDSFERYGQYHTNPVNIGYSWEQGDMLRILTDSNRNVLHQVVEARITGQRGRWITVAAVSSIPELFGGELIEVYRPRKATETDNLKFYDLPNGIVTINDPYGTPTWSFVSGTLQYGSSWILPTQVPIRPDTATAIPVQPWRAVNVNREAMWLSDFYPSSSWGKGKVGFQDPDARVIARGSLMRYTDPFLPGTNINGLNLVNGAVSFELVENSLGPINNINNIGDVLFCNCTNGSFSVYKGVLETRAVDSVIKAAGAVLGNKRPFLHKHGTVDRLSVVRGVSSVFFFDRKLGAWVQYAGNALQDMAEQNNMSPYFQTKAIQMGTEIPVCAGWDMVHKEFIATFAAHTYDDGTNVLEIDGESMKYHDPSNKFTCALDASPDCWGRTRQKLFSFQGGQLWEHHATDRYNEIYGQQVPMQLDTPFVFPEWQVLSWENIQVRLRGAGWEAPLIYNLEGQITEIPVDGFGYMETRLKASIMKDLNTANPSLTTAAERFASGSNMTSTEIVIRLEHNKNGYAEIIALNAYFVLSDSQP